MKRLIILFFLISSCGQDFNSNTFDKERYGNTGIDTSTPAGLRFSKAYNVVQTNCSSCHTGYHNIYSGYTTSQAWVDAGLVVAGDFTGSFIIQKLKNYGGNMPGGASQLSESEINYLSDWISNL
ncbi:MAG: cytochrome c [Bacteriovoracaceae bacterium]|nr:cytochrome c [Bacteriovoracaceae bacterium]